VRRQKKDAIIDRMNLLRLDLFDIDGTPEQRKLTSSPMTSPGHSEGPRLERPCTTL